MKTHTKKNELVISWECAMGYCDHKEAGEWCPEFHKDICRECTLEAGGEDENIVLWPCEYAGEDRDG